MRRRRSKIIALLDWATLHRTPVSILAHLFLFTLALLLAFGLANNFQTTDPWVRRAFVPVLPGLLLIKLVVFHLMGLWRGSWRYVGLRDLLSVVMASQVATFLFVLCFFLGENFALATIQERIFPLTPGGQPDLLTAWAHRAASKIASVRQYFPDSVFLLDWAATIGVVCAARMSLRLYYEEFRTSPPGTTKRILIVGAGDAGEALLREIIRLPDQDYQVVGFLDDEPRRKGNRIHGVEVLGGLDLIVEVCEGHSVEEVLIAMPTAPQKQIRLLVERCQGLNVRFRTVPPIADVIEGRVQVSQLRAVEIEDLLARDPVQLDTQAIETYIRNRRVLVTGAGGSIGAEMCRQIARFRPACLALVEQAENNLFEIDRELRSKWPDLPVLPFVADICDRPRILTLFSSIKPSAIFHAAAHKHVPMMEGNPGEAVKNNILGTRMVADAAAAVGVEKVVMISTDKAVNPTSIMGCTKRVAEMYVQELSSRCPTQFVTVRFGNVLGSSGSVVPIFKKQIAEGGPVTVTHPDMMRYFMTIPEASQLVLQAGAMGKGGEIYLLDMGDPVRILDLANDLITLSGLRPGEDIEIVFSGVRPGEKLMEQLSIEGEGVSRTKHPKIGIWERKPGHWNSICSGIDRLVALADSATPAEIRAALSELVPEYAPEPLLEGNGGLPAEPGATSVPRAIAPVN